MALWGEKNQNDFQPTDKPTDLPCGYEISSEAKNAQGLPQLHNIKQHEEKLHLVIGIFLTSTFLKCIYS